ncbi:SDR family NAD(P)-dependent oxidoreductase, partial [Mesorhizobium sp. M00.F.Ca.ET.158.01.1.1]
ECGFIDACKEAGVTHVVKFSGAESNIGYDATQFRFTRMHEEVERYLEGAGMAWTHLRPSQFMQVYLRDAPTIAREGAFYLALGDTELSPVDVEDI